MGGGGTSNACAGSPASAKNSPSNASSAFEVDDPSGSEQESRDLAIVALIDVLVSLIEGTRSRHRQRTHWMPSSEARSGSHSLVERSYTRGLLPRLLRRPHRRALGADRSALSLRVAIRTRPSASRAISTPSARWKNVLIGLRTRRVSHTVGISPTWHASPRSRACSNRDAATRL